MNIINIIGLVFAAVILVLHAKFPLRPAEERPTAPSVIRGIGFYGSLFLLGFNLGILELDAGEGGGAGSVDFVELFWIWAILGLLLTAGCATAHLLTAKKGKRLYALYAVLTFLLFFLSALLRGHILEFPFALLWLGGHIPMLFKKTPAVEDGQEKEGK